MPTENLKTLVLSRGRTGNPLVYKLQQQKDPTVVSTITPTCLSFLQTLSWQMTELGQILSNLVNIIPDGMVVFFPSYSFLNALRVKWKEAGILDRLSQKKTVRNLSL